MLFKTLKILLEHTKNILLEPQDTIISVNTWKNFENEVTYQYCLSNITYFTAY